ncbi:MAG: TonB-dependent receptor [Nitrospirae bacterium]|nr:TonB-dependent receptor [Nitrospirota bacterium]
MHQNHIQSFVRTIIKTACILLFGLLVWAGGSGHVFADDEPSGDVPPVLISATRSEQSLDSTTSSATIITAKELQDRQLVTVGDALRSVVGVSVLRNGGPGGLTNVFLRGADSEQTLVMIDGVQVNNPSVGGFDFADLTTDNIERIEIVRGPMSSLYGSDANGGVINIITKKGQGAPKATLSIEGGRYATTREAAALSGQSGPVDYSLSLSHERSEGFSRVSIGAEPDSYLNTTLSSKLGLSVLGDGRLEFTGRYWLAQADLDGFDALTFLPADDPAAAQRTEGLVVALSLQKPLADWWNQRVTVSLNTAQYWNKFLDTFLLTYQRTEFDTREQHVDWQHDLAVGGWMHVTTGAEYEGAMGENSGDVNRHTVNTVGFYAQSLIELPQGLSQTTAVRYDINNRYGNTFTYKIEAAYLAPTQTRVRAGLGTAFHGPTIQDLFYPNFGNPNLQSETSETAEVGLEQSLWDKRVIIGVTQFRTTFDNLIEFRFDPVCVAPYAPLGICPVNVDTARAEGQEVTLTLKPVQQVMIASNYTHLTAKDRTTDTTLLRRPRDKAHLGVTVTPITPVMLGAEVDFVGRRLDSGGPVGSYWLVRATGSYAVTTWLQLFGRIENLTNKDYEETLGYETAGLSLFGGVRVIGP